MPVQPWIFDPSNKTLLWQVFNIYVVDVNQNQESIIDIDFTQVDNATYNFTVQF